MRNILALLIASSLTVPASAQIAISSLPSAVTPLSGTEVVPIVQGGVTKKVSATNLAATGTVTSVAVSGGTTGLTVSGSPVTSTGTMTLSGVLGVANGGTACSVASVTCFNNITGLTAAGSTGSSNLVFSTNPVLTTPNLGTPSAVVLTNATGTASSLTAGHVTTNANLTGPITSVGNATSVASQTGTGSTFVMSASPTLTGNPAIAAASATSLSTTGVLSAGFGSNPTQGNFQAFTSVAGGAPQTSGTTDANQVAMLSGGSVQLSFGVFSSGASWIQQRSSAGFNTNYDVQINPNGGNVYVGPSAVPTPSGTCSINTQLGRNTVGSFKANGACASGTIILTFMTAAANGWACNAKDLTTPANAMNQTAYTASTATFSGSMTNADLVTFSCFPF